MKAWAWLFWVVSLLAVQVLYPVIENKALELPMEESLLQGLNPSTRRALEAAGAFDFVVVGGGTAGCLVAAGLARANHSVLLVEAGSLWIPPSSSTSSSLAALPFSSLVAVESSLPALQSLSLRHAKGPGGRDWGISYEPQNAPLLGSASAASSSRRLWAPRGRQLGGSEELGRMLHVEATPADWDHWAELVDDPSWSARHMRRYEDMLISGLLPGIENPAQEDQEDDGGWESSVGELGGLTQAWMGASGLSRHGNTTDYNRGLRLGGFLYRHATQGGVRSSSLRRHLLPLLGRLPNLKVLTRSVAWKITFDNASADKDGSHDAVATGVQLISDDGRDLFRVTARREVILCAGTLRSPQVLLQSGIGPREALERLNITLVTESPGVGSSLQDHPAVPLKYRLGKEGGAWWPLTRSLSTPLASPHAWQTFQSTGKGPLASSGWDFGFFGASNASFERRPDLQLHGCSAAGDSLMYAQLLGLDPASFEHQMGLPSDFHPLFAQGATMSLSLGRPNARGFVTLRSTDPLDSPQAVFEAFADADDIRRMVVGIRQLQEIMAQAPLQALRPELLVHRQLAADFGADSDAYWAEYIRRFGSTNYDPSGTCAMGSVVDSSLRVMGVSSLRVADASVMPEIPSSDTNAPTAAIALRLLDLVLR